MDFYAEKLMAPKPGAPAKAVLQGGHRPLVLLCLCLLPLLTACGISMPITIGPIGTTGADLGGVPAPDFTLQDDAGKSVTMGQFRGKAVALTFIYTSCPDVCPLITQKFGQAYEQLGSNVAKVGFLGVTVDPETDTPQRIAEYSEAMGMTNKWSLLTASRSQLEPIWKSYYVAPMTADQAQLLLAKGPAAAATDPSFAGLHTAGVFVIDPSGKERRLLDADFTVRDLVADLQSLI